MIRPVKPADIAAITEIYNWYVTDSVASFETTPLSVEEMQQRIDSIIPRWPYFVYEAEGEVIGFCYAHPWKERAAYCDALETTIYLSRHHVGKGIGRKLIEALIPACREAGAHALIACITGGNEASIELHRKMGFEQVSFFKEVGMKFGRRLDVVDMEIIL